MKTIFDKEFGKYRPMTVAEEMQEVCDAFRAFGIALAEALGIGRLTPWLDKRLRRNANGLQSYD